MDEKEKYEQEIIRIIKEMNNKDMEFIKTLYTLCCQYKRKRGD